MFDFLKRRKEQAETRQRMAEWLAEQQKQLAAEHEQRLIKVAQERTRAGYEYGKYKDFTNA